MNAPWTPDPCIGNAAWTAPTVCRRPYGRGAYDAGPYGRCAIIGGAVWGEEASPCPIVFTPPVPMPWRRSARG